MTQGFDLAQWRRLLDDARAAPPSDASAAYGRVRDMLATLKVGLGHV